MKKIDKLNELLQESGYNSFQDYCGKQECENCFIINILDRCITLTLDEMNKEYTE